MAKLAGLMKTQSKSQEEPQSNGSVSNQQQITVLLSQFIKRHGLQDDPVRVTNWAIAGEKIEGQCATPEKQFDFTVSSRGLSYKPKGATRSDAYHSAFWAQGQAIRRSDSAAYLEGFSRTDGNRKRCQPSVGYNCGATCIKNGYTCHLREGRVAQDAQKLVSMAKALRDPTSASATLPQKAQPAVPAKKAGGGDPKTVIAEKEEAIRQQPIENAVVVDAKTGEVLLEKQGGEDYVAFTEEELAKMRGQTLTHNHPSFVHPQFSEYDEVVRGSSFSPEDIQLATYNELAEIRAVGLGYTHSMKPPQDGWNQQFWDEKVVPSIDKHIGAVYLEQLAKIRRQQASPGDMSYQIFHELWTRVSQETGMTYTRTEQPISPEEVAQIRKPIVQRKRRNAMFRKMAVLGLAAVASAALSAAATES